ncbi:RNA methyltransferase [Endomicrobiia bacterium]|nr:RNA methyltransferase [Endomicrobiia bacterium]
MLPLYKLEQLPRSQRLRKIARDFGGFESRLVRNDNLTNAEIQYVTDILALLARDAALQALLAVWDDTADLRRSLNTIRHILLAETDHYPADWDFIGADGVLDPAKRRPFPGMRVYLEDIRSPFNVGAMFRTAESFGVEKILLSPLCADPHHPRAERTAMGCVDVLPWERVSLDAVKALGGPIFALETGGIDPAEFSFPGASPDVPARGIMIVGSEELGVSPEALALADASLGRLSITTYGAKGSLNVSVAFGIAMQKWAEVLHEQFRFRYPESI